MIRPRNLNQGDFIGIIPPAKNIHRDYVSKAIRVLEQWGLKVILSGNIYAEKYQYAGDDQQRLSELQKMLDDPSIRAIFCARGGYGTTRIIDEVSLTGFAAFRKWVIGFSDITSLLIKINLAGIECIHGPMPINFGSQNDEVSMDFLKQLLFTGADPDYIFNANPLNKPGTGHGEITGGNITLLSSNIGTITDFDTKKKILFIEEVDEYLYRLDRMMVHLKRAGKLAQLAGLVVGYMTNMKDNESPFGKNAQEIILEHVASCNFPVCFGAPIGHEYPNLPIPMGRYATLNVMDNQAVLSFKK